MGRTSQWENQSTVALPVGIVRGLKRVFGHGGRRVSFLSADCPATNGYPSLALPFARASLIYTVGGGQPNHSAKPRRGCARLLTESHASGLSSRLASQGPA